jgi:hypothetical protein
MYKVTVHEQLEVKTIENCSCDDYGGVHIFFFCKAASRIHDFTLSTIAMSF